MSNKKGLRFLTLVLGLLGNNVMNVRADECLILKNALDNLVSKFNDNSFGDLTNCCSSSGGIVTCENNHITKILLSNSNLSGSIPASIGNLTFLKELELYGNNISGSIPSELGNLSNLEVLDLYENQLSGNIPPELGNLTSLIKLRLSSNKLTGSIPPELGNLFYLEDLWLCYNQLSGSIPPEFGNLTNLKVLKLNDNHLSNTIPKELENLNLQTFNFENNKNESFYDKIENIKKNFDYKKLIKIISIVVSGILLVAVVIFIIYKMKKKYGNKSSKFDSYFHHNVSVVENRDKGKSEQIPQNMKYQILYDEQEQEPQPNIPQQNIQPQMPQQNMQTQIPQQNMQSQMSQQRMQFQIPQQNMQPEVSHQRIQFQIPQKSMQPQMQPRYGFNVQQQY